MIDYYNKYKKYKSKYKYGGKCSEYNYNICGLSNGLCSNIGRDKATDTCICHRKTERCVKKNTISGLKERLSRLKESCHSSSDYDLFKKRSQVDNEKSNAVSDLFKKRSEKKVFNNVKKYEKQLKMGLPPLGVKKNIMEYLETLKVDNPERDELKLLVKEIDKRIDRESSGASESELLVNPLDNNYSGLLESHAIKLANKLNVKARPDLGYKYNSIEELYPELLYSKIKKIYDRLSEESEKQLIKRLFNKLRSNTELRKTHRNILFSGENLKKIRKDIEIKSYDYSKKEDEYDLSPISDKNFIDNSYDICKDWLSRRATGPLTGAEDKIKKRVCGNCLVSDDKDLFREKYDPKSKFCHVCCSVIE